MLESTITEALNSLVDDLVSQVIPIYTTKNPDPETGTRDCPIKVTHKEGKRYMMRHKILDLVRYYAERTTDKEE